MATYSDLKQDRELWTIPVTVQHQISPQKGAPAKDNNWYCLSVRGPDGKIFSATGTIPTEFIKVKLEGRKVTLTGYFTFYKGKQTFKWDGIIVVDENDTMSFLVDFLKTGKAPAVEMVKRFGDDLMQVIDKRSHMLLEIKGISQKKLSKIKENYDMHKKTAPLNQALAKLDASPNLKGRIGRYFGYDAAEIISQNPYKVVLLPGITSASSGFGFDKIAKFAKATDLPCDFNDDVQRARAAVVWAIGKISDQTRSTVVSENDILDFCTGRDEVTTYEAGQIPAITGIVPNIDADRLRSALVAMEKGGFIHSINGGYASEQNYQIELEIFNILAARREKGPKAAVMNEAEVVAYIQRKSSEMEIDFSDDQIRAIRQIASGTNTICISGYAGTGKSTISKALLDLLNEESEKKGRTCNTLCLALSGVASDRIHNVSGFPAKTIHSALSWLPGGIDEEDGFSHNADNPLDAIVLLVDEASMIDSSLFRDLLRAVNVKTKLIIIGDDAQLPPIGAGAVFCDLLNSKLMPVVHLEKIWRQGEDSVLTTFASEIRHGRVPEDYACEGYSDFEFIDIQTESRIFSKIIEFAQEIKPTLKDVVNDFQVLTPKNVRALGTTALNIKLQQVLNPAPLEKGPEINGFRKGDKVIHLLSTDMDTIPLQVFEDRDPKSTFDELGPVPIRIRNGAIGVVHHVSQNEKYLYVKYVPGEYPMIVRYERYRINATPVDKSAHGKKDKSLLGLAYALNVHKFQGSEAKNVIMPIHQSQSNMLDCRWLYTAITRAKSKCKIIGQPSMFEQACLTLDRSVRNTVLQYLIACDNAEWERKEAAKPKNKRNNKLGWVPPGGAAVAGGVI